MNGAFKPHLRAQSFEGVHGQEVPALVNQMHSGIETANPQTLNVFERLDSGFDVTEITDLNELKIFLYQLGTYSSRVVWDKADKWIAQNNSGLSYRKFASRKNLGELAGYEPTDLELKFSRFPPHKVLDFLKDHSAITFQYFAKSWNQSMGAKLRAVSPDNSDRDLRYYSAYASILARGTKLNLPNPSSNNTPETDIVSGYGTQSNLDWSMFELVPKLFKRDFPDFNPKTENFTQVCKKPDLDHLFASVHQDVLDYLFEFVFLDQNSKRPSLNPERFKLEGTPGNFVVKIDHRALREFIEKKESSKDKSKENLKKADTRDLVRLACPALKVIEWQNKARVIDEVHDWFLDSAARYYFPRLESK